MRTSELMNEFMRHPGAEAPQGGWQRLVWHAADLVRLAISLRNTAKTTRRAIATGIVQEDLFN